ncbi:MAG: MiaB/RimO family radical SAM methylthiotransferase, partial [Actinomycetota bacterium]
FAADLPRRRERDFQAWLQLSMGCNSVCSYCIVPSVRGRERSRHPREVLAEARQLAAEGVVEVMLLGQNVNSYGRDLPPDERCTFAEMLRAVDAIDGIGRIRFMSPHPKDMRGDVISAMAESEAVCHQLHLPLQSGSTRVLKRMRRTYDRGRYLDLVGRLREAMPDIALTTDVIVGFPGETDGDFEDTLDVYEQVGFDHAFTFIYSPRRGTEAAGFEDQVPDAVKHERLERLVDVVQGHAARRNAALVGTTQEVLSEGPSRTDPDVFRGKTRGNKTALFTPAAPAGSVVSMVVEESTSQTLRGRILSPVPA